MLCKRIINIEGIPKIIWGPDSKKVYLYVHGKMGCKESAIVPEWVDRLMQHYF